MQNGYESPTRWLNEKSVAAQIGLSISCLQKWRFYGRGIPYSKVGRSVRYAEADVVAYMESKKIFSQKNYQNNV